ncbi:MAG: hypothetical protein ACFFDN_50120 [Candidatus Hodarchaeota archaeon]
MSYFSKLREKQSKFYQQLWQEISEMKIIDTHEHFWTIKDLKNRIAVSKKGERKLIAPDIFRQSYVFIKPEGTYEDWLKELKQYRGTGYLKTWLIALEELYGIEGPINESYLKIMEVKINNAYKEDFEKNSYYHLGEILRKKMNIQYLIQDITLEEHLEMPQPMCQAAARLPSIMEGITVPAGRIPLKPEDGDGNNALVYWFAQEKLRMNLDDIKTLDDYLDITEKLMDFLKYSGHYKSIKLNIAYDRPLYFHEPSNNEATIRKRYNDPPHSEKECWLFGDYMMHFILEWMQENWRVPIQIHTGLARIYDDGSDATNLSNLFLKFPDLYFDLMHGNYPFNKMAGMLHQIPNINADLCWLPAISQTAAQRTLTEIFEVGDMLELQGWDPYHTPMLRTSLFGGDSAMVEGAYGALQIAKDVLIRTLEDLHNRGHIFKVDAIDLAEQMLYSNPKRIFNL